MYGKNTGEDVIRNFWDRVDKRSSNECWLWIGSIKPNGYGNFMVCRDKPINAHRMCWRICYGPIPDNMNVLHKCDNPRCVNPHHLFLGTQVDNLNDAKNKGRRIGRPRKY